MRRITSFICSAGAVSALATTFALTACGGGGGDVETTTVAKTLDAAPATVSADGTIVLSTLPPKGASQLAVDSLSRIGVQTLSKKCGQTSLVASNADRLLSAGGTPTFVVLLQVAATDADKAQSAGFVIAGDDYNEVD